MLIDLVNECKSVNGLTPQDLTQSTQGAFQDFSNCKIATAAIIDVGAFGANTTNLQIQIEENSLSSGGTWTVINGVGVSSINGTAQTTAITQMIASAITTSAQHIVLKGQRQHRYVRANAVSVQGTTPGVFANVEIISELQFAGTGGGYSRLPSS